MSCPECEKKDLAIQHLTGANKNYKINLETEKIRTIALSNALQEIFKIAKDKMWYPCSFEDHEAVDREQEVWHGV